MENKLDRLQKAIDKHPNKVLKRMKKMRKTKHYKNLSPTEQEQIDSLIEQLEQAQD
jgi:hypothetical protein